MKGRKSFLNKVKKDASPLRWLVFKMDDYQCVYCGQQLERGRIVENRTVDHLVPKSWAVGFPIKLINSPQNLVTSCRPCNERLANTPRDKKNPRYGRFSAKVSAHWYG